ncbi:MAG: LPS export ABC transporter ATP-binding protein [Puniceicoccales bacterium]|jgi:lipopolysaccharide export system ATP-binding protein|nr:LPS export ABC transporter ATP-binding protein [Puniceicoccales bacterium]
MSEVLRARNLVKRYGDKVVVNDVDVEVCSGEIVGLLGPNGAGKTTTFYVIIGLVEANDGRVFINDVNITRYPLYKRAQLGVGYFPQEDSVFRKLTVYDNLLGVAEYLEPNREKRRMRVETVLSELRISHVAKQKAYTLSGGEKRRLEIARILLLNPKFLLMDEPFSGVDPISISDLQKIIISLKNRGIGVLITDHNVRETLSIVDRAYLIHEGRVLCHGDHHALLNDEASRKFYLGDDFKF